MLQRWIIFLLTSRALQQGEVPLVIAAASADIIATLITLKAEAEAKLKTSLKFTIIGGAEAHILAKELGDANIGVILSPARPFPNSWEERRMYVLPGYLGVRVFD